MKVLRPITRINLEFDEKSFKNYPLIREKFIRAADEIEKVINTEEFKSRVLTHVTPDGRFQYLDTEKDNEGVYRVIMSGIETLRPTPDGVWNLKVILYYSWKGVIGYTYRNRNEIWANRKFHGRSTWTIANAANNLTHEYQHKQGFEHSFKRSWKWPYTVPYAIGRMVGDMIANKLARNNPEDYIVTEPLEPYNHMSKFTRVYMKVRRFFTRWF